MAQVCFDNRTAPLAVFYQPRAPPLLKFWFSQNFRRMEESVWDSTVQQRKQNLIVNGQNCEKRIRQRRNERKSIQKYMSMTGTASAGIVRMNAGATKMPSIEIDGPDDDRRSALFRKSGVMSTTFDETGFQNRYAWVDTLEDERLLRAIMKLNKKTWNCLPMSHLRDMVKKSLREDGGVPRQQLLSV